MDTPPEQYDLTPELHDRLRERGLTPYQYRQAVLVLMDTAERLAGIPLFKAQDVETRLALAATGALLGTASPAAPTPTYTGYGLGEDAA